MARYGRLLADAQWEKIPSLLPEAVQAPAWRQTASQRSQSARRILYSAQRRSLAGFARGIPLTGNVLASPSGLGRARSMAHHFAGILGELNQREQLAGRGHEVGGGGRRPECSSGKAALLCIANEVRHAEETLASIRVTRPTSRRTAMPETTACDCRSRLLQQSAAQALGGARHRILGTASPESQQTAHTQDGRALRRYRRRWKSERTFAWLGNFRRLVVRYDRSTKNYEAFFPIACFMFTLRRVLK